MNEGMTKHWRLTWLPLGLRSFHFYGLQRDALMTFLDSALILFCWVDSNETRYGPTMEIRLLHRVQNESQKSFGLVLSLLIASVSPFCL